MCRVSIGEVDGALPSLVKLLASEEQSVREEAARAIHNLALEPDSQAPALISAGAVEALLEMLKEKVMDGDYDTQRAACQALAVLSPHRGSPEALLRVEAGVSWLLQLLRPPTPAQVQALAAQTVAGFAADEQAAAEMQVR